MIDIGANLAHRAFDADRDAVIARARAAGVDGIVVTGVSVAESRAAARLAAEREGLWHTAGVHPHEAKSVAPGWLDDIAALAAGPKAVAIGEAGLDFYRNYSPPAAQEAVFAAQADLAAALNMPLFVHDRCATEAVARVLAASGVAPDNVVIHCFTGSRAALEGWIAAGFYIGITGWICDERRGAELRELAPLIPAHRLLIETDAPFLLPRNLKAAPHAPKPQGRRNEPAFLRLVAAGVAAARGDTEESIAALASANASRLFRLPAAEAAAASAALGQARQ